MAASGVAAPEDAVEEDSAEVSPPDGAVDGAEGVVEGLVTRRRVLGARLSFVCVGGGAPAQLVLAFAASREVAVGAVVRARGVWRAAPRGGLLGGGSGLELRVESSDALHVLVPAPDAPADGSADGADIPSPLAAMATGSGSARGVCRRWLRGTCTLGDACVYRHATPDARELRVAERQRAEREAAQLEAVDPLDPYAATDKLPKAARFRVLAQWLVDTYGIEQLRAGGGVLDVAGGGGALSAVLAADFGVQSCVVDPRGATPGGTARAVLKRDAKRRRREEAKQQRQQRAEGGKPHAGCADDGQGDVSGGAMGDVAGDADTDAQPQGAHLGQRQQLAGVEHQQEEQLHQGKRGGEDERGQRQRERAPRRRPLVRHHPLYSHRAEMFLYPKSGETVEGGEAAAAAARAHTEALCDAAALVVGLHADEATDAIVDAALAKEPPRPFVLLPCCSFPARHPPGSARAAAATSLQLAAYLQSRHPAIRRAHLPVQGRNVVLFVLPPTTHDDNN